MESGNAVFSIPRLSFVAGRVRFRQGTARACGSPAPLRLNLFRRLTLLLGLIVLILPASLFAQTEFGSVVGSVIESWEGKPLAGVTVTVRGTTLATATDPQGRFQLNQVPPGEQTLRFSKSGYAAATVTDVRVLGGQQSKVDGVLRPEFYEMEEYEVTAEEFQEQAVQLLQDRQQASALMDAMGSEQFSRVGAGDAAEIMAKVTGVTMAEGKYAVIRGLSDRYTATLLNGAEVPSADPYRRAVQLDLFPSDMIERVVVAKTFTPDLPGGFAGGAANIVTKSFPEKFLFNLGVGVGYNTQTSLKDSFTTYKGGGTDWLALDDGTRKLPRTVSSIPPNQLPRPPFSAASSGLMEEINAAFESHQFAPIMETAPVNHDFSLSFGNTMKLFNRKLGVVAGLNFEREFSLYEDGRRASYEGGVDFNTFKFGLLPKFDLKDVRGAEEASWGAVASLAYELSDAHQIGYTFLQNQTAEKVARRLNGYENRVSEEFPGGYFDTSVLAWTERNLNAHQFRGHHEFPALLDSKTDWLISLAGTGQEEPELRFFSYYGKPQPDGSMLYEFSNNFQPTYPTRYFRDLKEDNLNLKFDETVPFKVWRDLEAEVKAGLALSQSERTYEERSFQYLSQNDFQPFTTVGDPNALLTDQNLRVRPGNQFDRYVANYPVNFDYSGEINVKAYYGMVELPIWERLRLIGGARLEQTDLSVDTLNKNTGTRAQAGIDQTDVLPAFSVVWTIVTNLNLRASVSQTIARPTYREISPAITFDFVGGDQLVGNPNLKISQVRNYDLRWEWFPRPGEVLSASLFYKEIDAPIEKTLLGVDSRVTYINSDAATLLGAEIEARKNLDFLTDHLEDFSLGFNLAYIQSEVPRSALELANRARYLFPASPKRPLFDQSPYIANVDLTWANERLRTTATVVLSYFAERLAFVNLDTPDIYEQPAPQLDFILSQRLGKGWKVKLSAKNLLDPEIKHTYDFGGGGSEIVYASHKKGLTFKLGISYEF